MLALHQCFLRFDPRHWHNGRLVATRLYKQAFSEYSTTITRKEEQKHLNLCQTLRCLIGWHSLKFKLTVYTFKKLGLVLIWLVFSVFAGIIHYLLLIYSRIKVFLRYLEQFLTDSFTKIHQWYTNHFRASEQKGTSCKQLPWQHCIKIQIH